MLQELSLCVFMIRRRKLVFEIAPVVLKIMGKEEKE